MLVRSRWRCKDWTPRTMAYELMSDHYNCLLDARCVRAPACASVSARAHLRFTCFSVSVNVPQPSADIFGAGLGPCRKGDTTLCTKRRLSRARSCTARGRCAVLRAFPAHHALYTSGTNLARIIHKRSVHTARGTLNVHRTLAPMFARLLGSLQACFPLANRRLARAANLRAVCHWRIGASTFCVPLIDF